LVIDFWCATINPLRTLRSLADFGMITMYTIELMPKAIKN
jgi:hypothetical protein